MIREDLVAERVAIESYSEIIRWLGDKDPTTRNLMVTILAVEEEHANDMLSLLEDLGQGVTSHAPGVASLLPPHECRPAAGASRADL